MSNENIQQSHPVAHVESTPSASNPSTAEAIASMHSGGSQVTSKTTISSLNDLKKKAPQLYQQMMIGIAMTICSQMQHAQDRVKEMMRKARQSGESF